MVRIFHPRCYPLPCSLFGCILFLSLLVILLVLITLSLCLFYMLLCISLTLSLSILSSLLLLNLILVLTLSVLVGLSRIAQMAILLFFLSFSFVCIVWGLAHAYTFARKGEGVRGGFWGYASSASLLPLRCSFFVLLGGFRGGVPWGLIRSPLLALSSFSIYFSSKSSDF